jgi:shikimate kinase
VRVLLVGLPGAGVTTVGGLLAQRMGWPFLDEDVLLERTGSPSRALTLVLGMPGQLVAAVPDGIVQEPAERSRLATPGTHVVWLRCSTRVLARRLGNRLGDDAEAQLRRLASERLPLYEEVATQVLDTDVHPAGAIANSVIDQVRG